MPMLTVFIVQKFNKNNDKIKVVTGSKASVDIALLYDCKAIIRGLRSLSDYDYEVGLQQINKDISNGKINTVCLFADKEYQFISSSIVKEVLSLDKDVSKYVDDFVSKKLILKKEGFNYKK